MTSLLCLPQAAPFERMRLLCIDAETAREDRYRLQLSFTAGVVYAVFTSWPQGVATPLEVRLSWTLTTGARISLLPGAPNPIHECFYPMLHDLAHGLTRLLVDNPHATPEQIRAFADRIVPATDPPLTSTRKETLNAS